MNVYELKNTLNSLLAKYPAIAEDDELLIDTLEGETDFNRVIDALLYRLSEAQAMQEAIKAQIDQLIDRKARYASKEATHKSAIQDLLNAAGLRKLERPVATITMSKGRQKVNILDVDELPQGYFTTVRKADAKAIKSAIDAGEQIPGAELATGDDYLTIRRG